MKTGLKDRSAVISGGSKGIGKAIARSLAAEGVHVALLARSEEEVSVAAAEIAAEFGVIAVGLPTDITKTDALKAAAVRLQGMAEFKTIHIIVNNAAGPITSLERQIVWSDDEWMSAIDVKTVGALRIIREFLPMLATDGSGRVINVAGASGVAVWSPALLHGINNAAVIYATGFLAADLAPSRVTVNAIIPGLVATEFRQDWAQNLGEQQGKTSDQAISELCKAKGILLGRMAEMEEIGDLAVFLASDRASYITGAKIPVDGGFLVNAR
ncbi:MULTISPECIES: SDR family oxidoreductase [unclassified Beijerinckia]|uniref:SDR family NAD(P)-dependent oxidoreductase n=1 Tax=unclassified Beijerinckia TaxID=2638183 RepID=UPI000896E627|nr:MULTISPECIES: SDR family oxidoreductase [unclassified Beijerinckia]MDH7798314.1 3-oxoacyl-[acyl-carrier protein] reductase [Beijerinckia sp. GAS462]SED16714.1 NAD(P)-dependent dehydrogenase, short-chain alcohol dehydrogenase family [Beijerinckia sp. 28-YEA-48]